MSASPETDATAYAATAALTASRLTTRTDGIELPLNVPEFDTYVLALRNYAQRASTRDMADWRRRTQAFELLHDVRRALGGDHIDTAHLRACNETRGMVGDHTPYPLRLAGEIGGIAVLALEEYGRLGGPEALRSAGALMERIASAVTR